MAIELFAELVGEDTRLGFRIVAQVGEHVVDDCAKDGSGEIFGRQVGVSQAQDGR